MTRPYNRAPGGTGWWSTDREVFLERGAPMSCGGTAWLVWFKAREDELEWDNGHAYGRDGAGSPRTPHYFTLGAVDDDTLYVHLNDAGSLYEAKETAEIVMARRG